MNSFLGFWGEGNGTPSARKEWYTSFIKPSVESALNSKEHIWINSKMRTLTFEWTFYYLCISLIIPCFFLFLPYREQASRVYWWTNEKRFPCELLNHSFWPMLQSTIHKYKLEIKQKKRVVGIVTANAYSWTLGFLLFRRFSTAAMQSLALYIILIKTHFVYYLQSFSSPFSRGPRQLIRHSQYKFPVLSR